MAALSWITRAVWLEIIWPLVLHPAPAPSPHRLPLTDSRTERTFLAWLRTSLAFASIGIAITQLFRLNTTIQEREGGKPVDNNAFHLRQVGKPLGATFLGIAVVILLIGGRRYFESQVWSSQDFSSFTRIQQVVLGLSRTICSPRFGIFMEEHQADRALTLVLDHPRQVPSEQRQYHSRHLDRRCNSHREPGRRRNR